ncbi:hypothetical protein RugamoR57_54440 [Duganella caerulea]
MGGSSIPLRVELGQLTGPVTWSLDSGSPGTLIGTTGNLSNYAPPDDGSILVDTLVRVIATAGGQTATTEILLHPVQPLTQLLGPTDDPQAPGNPLESPGGIARDSKGNIYVSDQVRGTITKLTPSGVPSQFAKLSGGIGALAFDGAGNLYAAYGSSSILKFTPDGNSTVLVGRAGFGSVDGPADVATLRAIRGLVATSNGTLYVTDNRTVRKIDPTGYVTTIAGHCDPIGSHDGDIICAGGPSVDGDSATARFTAPDGITVDNQGILYVHDSTIRTVGLDGSVRTLVSGDVVSYGGGGGIARDPAGNLYIAASAANAVLKVAPDGSVTTVAYAVGQDIYHSVVDVKYVDAHTLLVLTRLSVQLLTLP